MTTDSGTGALPENEGAAAILEHIVTLIGVVLGGSNAIASGNLEIARQFSMARERPTLLAIADAVDAQRRGIISEAQFQNTLDRHGLSSSAQEAVRALGEQLLSIGELVELFKRRDIDGDEYTRRAALLGYESTDAARILGLAEFVPSAIDVVQFAVREVYTPEIAEKYGQFSEFPEDAMADFERAGVPRSQAVKYWASHWGLPSIQMAMEMYHRRAETGFTLEDLMALMRAQDVMPYYRDKILAIASSNYTRVDVRRMHKLGILTLEQVAEAYQALGYNDERAQNMARFTEELNSAEDDAAIEPFRAGIRGRVLSMYQSRTMPRADVESVLRDLGYKPEQIAAYITEAEFIRDADTFADWRSAIKRLYVAGDWTREQAIRKMLDFGFAEDEIVDLIPLWDVDRELRAATDAERAEKDLTKTEIIGAYTDELMGEVDAGEALRMLGYDDAEVEVLIRRADLARLKAQRTDTEATLHTLYVAGKKNPGDVRSQLGALNVTSARIDALLVKWDAELDAKSPELTVAQISAALKAGIIDEAAANRRLEHLGYAAEERTIIIALANRALATGG